MSRVVNTIAAEIDEAQGIVTMPNRRKRKIKAKVKRKARRAKR